MKKATLTVIAIASLALSLAAVEIQPGFYFGARTVADSSIKATYGNGTVYFPCLSVKLWKGLLVGLGYEGGYNKDGKLGVYQEPATLKTSGVELFAGYEFRLGRFAPYLKLGYGRFSYSQAVESAYVGNIKVDETKSTMTVGGGLRYYPLGETGVFLAGEFKYVPLKVKPYEDEVDLGGFRFLGGIGYSFGL
jgi:hypothetical protein